VSGGTRTILVAGEALFDLWLEGADVRGRPGGGPFNTARALARLGQRVAYLGALSDDGFGRRLRQELADDGVSLEAVVDTTAPSTVALADIDAAGGARYGFWREGTASAILTPDAALAAVPPGVDVLHLGTLGLVFEPVAEAMEAVARALAGAALVMVDPNVRPAAIADAAPYRARLGRVLALATVVKVSDEDLAWLAPGERPEDAARALLGAGPSIVLLTRGADGVSVLMAEGERDVPAPPVDVVDTIGAGDAFSGGFLAAWTRRIELDDVDDLRARGRHAAAAGRGAGAAGLSGGGRRRCLAGDLQADGRRDDLAAERELHADAVRPARRGLADLQRELDGLRLPGRRGRDLQRVRRAAGEAQRLRGDRGEPRRPRPSRRSA
jgi:fructokinase